MSLVMDRRDILRGTVGAGVGLLPLLGANRKARAATFPTRLVIYFTPQEPIDKAHWNPGPGFALTPVMQALEPHKSKILMVGDLSMKANKDSQGSGHYLVGPLLTGRLNIPNDGNFVFHGGGVSVDQYVAQKLNTKALVLGVGLYGGNPFGANRLSYTAAKQPVHPEGDPRKAFNDLFATFTQPPNLLADANARKKSILDVVGKHITSMRSQIAKDDYIKLDRHLEQVRALENKFNDTSPAGMISCTKTPPAATGLDQKVNADIPRITRAQIDIAVQSMACDLRRVVTLQLGSSGGFAGACTWPEEGINVTKDDHAIVHEFAASSVYPRAQTVKPREDLERYHYKQFAYFLKQMDSVVEGDGTLLDHSLVLWVKHLAENHEGHKDMMLMFAGGANGQIKTGRFLSLLGQPHENVLVNVCNLMGIPDTTFGDPKYCTGALNLG